MVKATFYALGFLTVSGLSSAAEDQQTPCHVTFNNYAGLAYAESIRHNVQNVVQQCRRGEDISLFAIQRQRGARRLLDMTAELCDPDKTIIITKNYLNCRLL